MSIIVIPRSSPPEVFCKKGVLKNFVKFTGKHLCQSLFLNKVAGLSPATLLKKRLWHRCSMNFAKFLTTSFVIEHFWWLLLKVIERISGKTQYNEGLIFAIVIRCCSLRLHQTIYYRSVLKAISGRGFVSIYHALFRHRLYVGQLSLRGDCGSDITCIGQLLRRYFFKWKQVK